MLLDNVDDDHGERPLSQFHLAQRSHNLAEIRRCLELDEQLLFSLEAAGCITTEHREHIALPTRTRYQ